MIKELSINHNSLALFKSIINENLVNISFIFFGQNNQDFNKDRICVSLTSDLNSHSSS